MSDGCQNRDKGQEPPKPWLGDVLKNARESKNKIQISRTDAKHILDAWAKMSILCSYLESSEGFTQKYISEEKAGLIYAALSKVVTAISPQLQALKNAEIEQKRPKFMVGQWVSVVPRFGETGKIVGVDGEFYHVLLKSLNIPLIFREKELV